MKERTRPVVRLATPADEPGIRALLRREVMPGRIRLTYEREPDFWLGCGEDCATLVACASEENREIVGLACRSKRRVFLNGAPRTVGYLSQLRIDSRYRGQWLVSRGFAQLRALHEADPLPLYLTSIVAGNDQATGVLVAGRRRHFPEMRPFADLITLALEVRARRRASSFRGGRVAISSASLEELPELIRFLNEEGKKHQFSTVYSEEGLQRLSDLGLGLEAIRLARVRGQVVGVAALWDQSRFKQTVIQGYAGWLEPLRPIYNRAAPCLGRTALPKPGETLRSAYVTLLSIAEAGDDKIEVFRALIDELMNTADSLGLRYLLLGLDVRDPLLQAAGRYRHTPYRSRLYLAEWADGERIDEQLDGRPASFDVATF